MGQIRAYLMSFVGLQLVVGRDRFAERFPHPWLVWEPGAWRVPQQGSSRTQLPSNPSRPGSGDALCFELAVAPGATVRAGRMAAHALVINDATFSRDQLIIGRPTPDSWTVAAIPGATPCTLDASPLRAAAFPLQSGSTLRAGDVTLRFYQTFDFVARLDTEQTAGAH